MSDDEPEAPAEKVKKAMASKRPPPKLGVIEGGKKDKPKRPSQAKKPAPPADDPPPHDQAPDGPESADDISPPGGTTPEEIEKARACRVLDQNDRDNGRRLLIWFGDALAYVSGMGWLTWRGTHWQRDEGDLGARLYSQNLVDRIKLEAIVIEASPAQQRLLDAAAAARKKAESARSAADEALLVRAGKVVEQLSKQRSDRRKFAIGSGNAGKTEAMLKQAASLKAVEATALDANAFQFNLMNGTLRFEKTENPESDPDSPTFRWSAVFTEHRRDDMITKRADVAYDAGATCPEFSAFLGITQPAADMQLFLQVFHGYALLLGGNDEQRLIFHYGTGANGKSAFMEAIGRMAGNYRAVVSPDTIVGEGQRDGSKANSDIARLHSTRFVTIEELPRGTPIKENLIKALTGGTRMVARFLQKELFEFDPKFTAVMSGNDMPTVGGDYGIFRRLLIVHWAITIAAAERIPFGQLMERFDRERPGILNWLVEGALRYLNEGLEPFVPESVRAFTDDYRQERDHVGVFVTACVIASEGSSVSAGDMFKGYESWCGANGLKPWSQTAFGTRLGALGIKKERGRTISYLDVRLGDVASRFDPKSAPPSGDRSDPGWQPPG